MPQKKKGERPDGLIQVTLTVGMSRDGKRLRKSFYGATRAEAEKKRDEYARSHPSGAPAVPDNITLARWIEIYRATYDVNANPLYYSSRSAPYKRLTAALGARRVSSIREADLQSELNSISGMSFSTVNTYRQIMRRVFSKARKNGLITVDPSEDLRLPPHTKGTHRALTHDEVALITAHCLDEKLARVGLWVMLMLYAGLRRGEMIALDWDSVDMENRLLNITQTAVIDGNQAVIEKRAKSTAGIRTVPIGEPLYLCLAAVPPEDRKGPVCVTSAGKRLTESACSRGLASFNLALERILNGEEPYQPGFRSDLAPKREARREFSFRAHDLRHTFCTILYESGVDVKSAAYLMGHADIRVTMEIYTHLSEETKSSAFDSFRRFTDALAALPTPLSEG